MIGMPRKKSKEQIEYEKNDPLSQSVTWGAFKKSKAARDKLRAIAETNRPEDETIPVVAETMPPEGEAQEVSAEERKAQADYEKNNELAGYVKWQEYKRAKGVEEKLRALAVIGAYMRGEKRGEIRKRFHLSPNRLNQMLNSDYLKDVMSYSLGHLFSMQDACLEAIMHTLTQDKDGRLAVVLLEKLGLFKQENMDSVFKEGDLNEEEDTKKDTEFAGCSWLQAGQTTEEIQQLIQHIIRQHPSHSDERH
jgi:hypothetical protein